MAPLMLCQLLVAFAWSQVTRADILISFPEGSDSDWVSRFTDGVEAATDIPAVGIVSSRRSADGAKHLLPSTATEMIEAAKQGYKELDFDRVIKTLKNAEANCLDTTPFARCRDFLFEVNLLRGMVLEARGKTEPAAQAFRSAHLADRTRIIDPRLYPPRISRAFAKACATSKDVDRVTLELTSTPPGASFFLNGQPVEAERVAVDPGRHIVESQFLGYKRMWRLVDVPVAGGKPVRMTFPLEAKSEMEAWKSLTDRISSPTWRPDEQGMVSLLERFNIEFILFIELSKNGPLRHEATIAHTGETDLIMLPSPGRPLEPIRSPFQNALKRALGITVPETPPAPLAVEEAPVEPEPAVIEEDEDPSIHYEEDVDDEPQPTPTAAPEADRRIVKSPWFWISVSAVAAIVAGFALTTQLAD